MAENEKVMKIEEMNPAEMERYLKNEYSYIEARNLQHTNVTGVLAAFLVISHM